MDTPCHFLSTGTPRGGCGWMSWFVGSYLQPSFCFGWLAKCGCGNNFGLQATKPNLFSTAHEGLQNCMPCWRSSWKLIASCQLWENKHGPVFVSCYGFGSAPSQQNYSWETYRSLQNILTHHCFGYVRHFEILKIWIILRECNPSCVNKDRLLQNFVHTKTELFWII